MAKGKKSSSSSSAAVATAGKQDIHIKAKGTGLRILEVGQGSLRMETTSRGQARGKLYSGTHQDTVEVTMQPDGTALLNIRYVHMTNKGEGVVGTGTGVQQPANSKGIAKFTGEGTMWSSSPRLSQLNGIRWTCEGDYNTRNETIDIRGKFHKGIETSPAS